MSVVDSSGWLEVFTNGSNKDPFVLVLRDTRALIVPAFVYFEVTKRARQLFGEAFAEKIEGLLQGGIFIEVTRGVTARAINASLEYKVALADSLIYATALEYDATLWTQDKHFKGLPSVKDFEKTA